MTDDKPQRKTSARKPPQRQTSAGAATTATDGKAGEAGEAVCDVDLVQVTLDFGSGYIPGNPIVRQNDLILGPI